MNYWISLFMKGIKNTREKTKSPKDLQYRFYTKCQSARTVWRIPFFTLGRFYCLKFYIGFLPSCQKVLILKLDFLSAVEGGREYGIWRQSWVNPYPQYSGARDLIFWNLSPQPISGLIFKCYGMQVLNLCSFASEVLAT